MPTESTTDFISRCAPLMRKDFDSCAGLSGCDLAVVTPDEIDGIYRDEAGQFRVMGALLETMIMGKACQIRENPLFNFVMAYAKHWGPGKLNARKTPGGLLDYFPYYMATRKGIINNNYWTFINGSDAGGTAPNGAAFDHYGEAAALEGIPPDENWFPERGEVFIQGKSAGGSATNTAWQVVDSVRVGAVVRLYLKDLNTNSNLSAEKLEPPTEGILIRGVPNIDDYESYCAQIPRINTKSQYPVWMQNTRWSICNDDLTQRFRQALVDNNMLYRELLHVEETEWNRELIQDFQYRFVHAFLFNKPLPNQSLETLDSLERIESWTDNAGGDYLQLPGIEARCVGRRANAVGVYEQMAECGRVFDLQGEPINLPELFQEIYEMHRVRQSNNLEYKTFEIVVDSAYRVQFIQGLFRYMNARYENTLRSNFDIRTETKTSTLGFVWTEFVLDYPAGVTLRVVSHMAFDDLLRAHQSMDPDSNTGNWALMLEWNSIYLGIIESNMVDIITADVKQLGSINADAFCRMKVPKRKIKHNSVKFGIHVDCPRASLWMENFSRQVPEHAVKVGVYGDLYGAQA